MTDTASSKELPAEPFWSRVRTALSTLRATQGQPSYGKAAIARSMGMKPRLGGRIEDELAQGWNHAASRRVSLSLLVMEIDHYREYFAAYGRNDADECVTAVMRVITDALPRSSDSCLRLGASSFVIVLPDLPALMARATALKISEAVRDMALPHKESHLGIVTLGAGLAVINPQGGYDRKFFEAAAATLKKARRKGMGKLEALDLRPAQERKRRAA